MSQNTVTVQDNQLVKGNHDFASITKLIADIPQERTPLWWYIAFGISNIVMAVMLAMVIWLIWQGIGVWGLQQPVGWGWDITNFVWWVGIGHAGTLISAILFLFRQGWRTAINRFAEAMTIFAVMCAGLFPAIHVGRIWTIYWIFPLPNSMQLWPNFNSPLLWDVFAVFTYLTVSTLFWYVGLVPDLATMRDRVKGKISKFVYGTLALGWTGGNRQWQNYEKAYMILAGLATPLVLSVHTIVSFDFAVSVIPGWHTTIFPPYFVAGAIFSGFAMVLSLMIIARKLYSLEDIMTVDHIEKMNIIILVTGNMVGFAYAMEFFIAWYGAFEYEKFAFVNRAFGPYAWAYWTMIICNVVSPQFFWVKKFRRNITLTFILSIVINIGMWFERFVITVTSLAQDYLPSSWGYFTPTYVDVLTYVGTFGMFFTFFLLFLRFLPMVAISEVKGVMPQADPAYYRSNNGNASKSD
ncbi:NrfD/PsrC family molybdoenzyme membrane anchor subunit [Natronogracilivirga saccharolytica]|uniref:Polysulfide reductase NrfD n=1 Tax=Natronogracilivirga saccharolytica TaxID=2812953 RepID=A0A8J7S2V5_9BACT|nr:NrfD/PsrC family molybdoenzyme membrane anchor subunit [Natronogracilivirga saccharolytica]MBP3191068.1 polysulfide reductase NrfD [Natronogracilivirga saccharolytica]